MPPAARITDLTTHGSPLAPGPGSPDVLIGGLPAWRTIIDQHACPLVSISGADGVGFVIMGSPTVFIDFQMACRQFDIVVEVPGLVMGPMNPIIMGEPTVIIGEVGMGGLEGMAPPPPTQGSKSSDKGAVSDRDARQKLARELIDKTGSADDKDVDLVAAELAKFPQSMLQKLKKQGTRIKVCRGSITEYRKDLRGVHPRGWPPGSTWDNVPGANSRDRNEVVIATVGHGTRTGAHVPKNGEGHGSANLVLHESAHAIDLNGGSSHQSAGTDFNKARNADAKTLSAYESQAGGPGQEETYAESAARYYEGDPNDAKAHPNLHNYWASEPVK